MSADLTPDPTAILLEKFKAATISKLTDEKLMVAHNVEVMMWREYDGLMMKLITTVLAHKLDGRVIDRTVRWSVPRGRWDHFKLAVLDERGRLDRLILRHWPVKYRTESKKIVVEVERWETFPASTIVPEHEFGQPVYNQRIRVEEEL